MSDYERIKESCLKRGELWKDPDFPATQTSVFYHQTPSFNFVWKRAAEIYSNPHFVLDTCDTFDVIPGKLGNNTGRVIYDKRGSIGLFKYETDIEFPDNISKVLYVRVTVWAQSLPDVKYDNEEYIVSIYYDWLQITESNYHVLAKGVAMRFAWPFTTPEYLNGDKWLVSCLGVLYLSKGLFYRVVPADQKMDSSYAGVFRFRLWWCGQWLEVLVDDRLPTVNGKLAFIQTNHTEQLWPALLEKAYAKLHGSYEALKYGSLLDGLADLTGGITESLPISDVSDPSILSALLRTTSVVTAHHNSNEEKIRGLETDMNYRIYSVEKLSTSEGIVHLVKLSRPPAPGEVTLSHIILDHSTWKSIPMYELDSLEMVPKGFWMLYNDFQGVFDRIEMVHLDADTSLAESSLKTKYQWQMKMHQGSWKRGVSAGGCRNYTNFFHMNPQIQIVLNEPDTVIISLNQHSIMEPKVVGFSVYKLPKFLTETAPALLFRKIKSTINSQYTNSRQVGHRCQLEASAYLVIPTTFEPREEANFSLRIFSNKSLKMKVLDDAPQMLRAALVKAPPGVENYGFAQYEAVFLQLADEHKTIDAFELQELLDACLPNDYIKSCASIGTCRQIVLSMDKNGTGRISLSDFKDLMCSLKHWQLVFKSHAIEKMGVLRAERLRDALREVGFVVPERAMSLLVLRYMRKDGMLRFGDFVSTVMHLHRAFNVFYTNESTRSDSINLNLSEWLKCSLMC